MYVLYLSYIIRDQNSLLFPQFDLVYLIIRKLHEIGNNLSFYRLGLVNKDFKYWGNIDLISNKKTTSNMGTDYNKLFS